MLLRALFLLMISGLSMAAAPPWTQEPAPSAPLDRVDLPPLDVAKALAEDYPGKPWGDPLEIGRVADVDGVSVGQGSTDAGRWTRLADGRELWRLAVGSDNAMALDFEFSRFRLPAGAELWIRTPDGKDWIGPYTDADNPLDGRFFTPRLLGSEAVIELRVPAGRREFVELELASVSRHYRDLFAAALEKSGSCNVDVACPTGDPYRQQINSVAHYSFRKNGGTFVCTGQLVATTQPGNDVASPTFVSAYHCLSTQEVASTLVLYWKYESPTCRTPGSSASGTPLSRSSNTAATQTGGTSLLAAHQPTDFIVLRLLSPVPAAAQAFWSGWDRSGATPTGSVTIHHPQGDEKRISINTDPLTITGSCILDGTPSNTHWRVNNWEIGTTEQGSSGSGLWRPDTKRLIGVLSGGAASCSAPLEFDCYGRLSTAWEGGGTAATRARDWLDPAGTGVQTLDPGATPTVQVSLSSAAFTTPAAAGSTITISAAASNGRAPYSYEWDVDGDGVFDRRGTAAQVSLSYARRTSTQVTVRATDADGAMAQTTRALDVRGPLITATASGGPLQVCGNGDSKIDPGERWRQPVRLANGGDAAIGSGSALFAAGGAGALSIGPNTFGYRGATSDDGGCAYSFINLDEEPALTTRVANGNSFGPLDDARTDTITLGGSGIPFYGQRYTQAVMSTNGYISFDPAETGGDWESSCSADLGEGARGPQLRVFHHDLKVNTGGLRYRHFLTCPRPTDAGGAQGCHVFQWDGIKTINRAALVEFQAVVYESSGQIVYQYRFDDPTDPPDDDGPAAIGILGAGGADILNVNCPSQTRTFSAAAESAVCLYAPSAQPDGDSQATLLPQPVQTFASIAAGGNAVVDVPFAVDRDAACGAPVAIDYIASAQSGVHSAARSTVLSANVGAGCQQVTSCSLLGPAPNVRAGLYFDPARDTNGVNTVLVQSPGGGPGFFGGLWYTGLPDRTPTWYELSGDLYELGGALTVTRYSNPAAPGGFAPVGVDAGQAWVGWGSDGAMLLAWDIPGVGSGAERMQRVPQAFAQPNHTSAWFNTGQPNWGVAIESLNLGGGSTLEFAATYLYDGSGAPRWVSGSLGTVNGGTFPMLGFEPQCPGCPRFTDVQSRSSNAGTMRITYSSPTSATLDSSITMPAPWAGTWVRSALPIIPIVTPTGAAAE